MRYTFRALEAWPYAPTRSRRSRYAFKAPWSSTLALLERELRILGAAECVIAAGFRERDLRLDGMPRSDARAPAHPGIIIAFAATGLAGRPRLEYGTDSCEFWEHNVRSIALGLEALRAVDRFGISRRGEQYAGFRELTTGADDQPTITRGRKLIREAGGVRAAKRATHPDSKNGDRVDFESVIMAERAIADVGA